MNTVFICFYVSQYSLAPFILPNRQFQRPKKLSQIVLYARLLPDYEGWNGRDKSELICKWEMGLHTKWVLLTTKLSDLKMRDRCAVIFWHAGSMVMKARDFLFIYGRTVCNDRTLSFVQRITSRKWAHHDPTRVDSKTVSEEVMKARTTPTLSITM